MPLPLDAIFQQRNTQRQRLDPDMPCGNPYFAGYGKIAISLSELIFAEMSSMPQKPL